MPAVNSAWEEQQLEVHQQKLRVILGQEELDRMDDPKAKPNARLAALKKELSALPEGAIPFMQGFNLWRTCAELRELAASPELAGTASQLLGCDRVRLYQDSIFVKRPGDGTTHWHSDLAMAPLDTNQFVTCWLPCQAVPAEEEGGSGDSAEDAEARLKDVDAMLADLDARSEGGGGGAKRTALALKQVEQAMRALRRAIAHDQLSENSATMSPNIARSASPVAGLSPSAKARARDASKRPKASTSIGWSPFSFNG